MSMRSSCTFPATTTIAADLAVFMTFTVAALVRRISWNTVSSDCFRCCSRWASICASTSSPPRGVRGVRGDTMGDTAGEGVPRRGGSGGAAGGATGGVWGMDSATLVMISACIWST